MAKATFEAQYDKLRQAMTQMHGALELLDEASAPNHIGCHLQMAICRLSEILPECAAEPDPAEVPRLTAR